MNKIRAGIVGTGYTVGIANNHVNGYKANEDSELVALYDIVPGRSAQWAEEKGLDNVILCETYDELLDNVDAVSICTPNYAHVPLAIRALEKGKHVLCEKPISIDAKEAQKASNYASCSNVVSMIGFSYRGIPAMRLMKKILDSGKMGKIFTYRETLGGCRIANPQVKLEWRMQRDLSGTGALADFGCHMLDLCSWLMNDTMGRMTNANGMVSCSINKRRRIFADNLGNTTNDDSAAFNVTFENGGIASFIASRLGVARHTLELYGEGGMLLFRDDKPNELEAWFKSKEGAYSGETEILTAPSEYIIDPWFNAEIDEFIDCIINGRQPDRNFERAVYIQKIIDKIDEACRSGQTVEL